MKQARNQIVLLGLLCQGLTWDDYLLPGLYALGWAGCLLLSRKSINIGSLGETLLLVAGVFGGFQLGHSLGYSNHFVIGHGLALMQLGRLLRPLNRRERVFTLLIALFQIAAACTFLFDYRFLLVLGAVVWLVPKALNEAAWDSFIAASETSPATAEARPPLRPRPGTYAMMAALAIAVFLLFPRGLMSGGLRLPVTRPGETGSLLDTVLDPSRSAGANSRRILFQIQGEKLNYLKCHTLTEFDGAVWRADPGSAWRRVDPPDEGGEASWLKRAVRVKNPAFLGRVIPADGWVMAMTGTFFRRPYQTTHGVIEAQTMWTGPNNYYEYWIATNPPPESLRTNQRDRFTRHPAPSPKLRAWLDERLLGITNRLDQARHLEQYFQRTFTYQLGAPELNRLNSTEDFLFNQRTGHCERYASTLAYLLRMQGIPSRVVIGYLPRSRNWVSGWLDVRLRDAHAWTEAWFPEHGWLALDATPAASLPPPSVWSDWLDALDFAWYAHVVNFDAPTQTAAFQTALKLAGDGVAWVMLHRARLLGAGAIGATLLLLGGTLWWWLHRRPRQARRRDAQIFVENSYGQMLRILSRSGHHRLPAQTPHEFLAELETGRYAGLPEADRITRYFCDTRYGGRTPEARELDALGQALDRLRRLPRDTRAV